MLAGLYYNANLDSRKWDSKGRTEPVAYKNEGLWPGARGNVNGGGAQTREGNGQPIQYAGPVLPPGTRPFCFASRSALVSHSSKRRTPPGAS